MTSWNAPFVTLLAGFVLAGALIAAPGPLPARGTLAGPGVIPTRVPHLKGDLSPSIHAYKLQGGPEIPNGGRVGSYGGPIPVQVTVANAGLVAVGSSTAHVRITRNGATVVDETFTQAGLESGAKGERWYHVLCPGTSNLISVEVQVDTGHAISEISETNNSASYRCTIEIAR